MNAKEEVKIATIKENITLTELVGRLNEKYNRNDTVQNLSNKLSRDSLRYSEALEIAEVLGYKIEWIKIA